MAKEGSVAPRERVNIVYKPATGGAQEEVELPLKLVMMGDYALRSDETPLEDRKVINIDKDNFSDVMRKQELGTTISVADKLSGEEGAQMSVNLKFDTLKDFDPESIVNQVPELKKLLQLRGELTAVKGPLGNIPAFRKKLQGILGDEKARERLFQELGVGEEKAGD